MTLGLESEKPTEIEVGFREDIMDGDIIILRNGDDGVRTRDLCLDRAIC